MQPVSQACAFATPASRNATRRHECGLLPPSDHGEGTWTGNEPVITLRGFGCLGWRTQMPHRAAGRGRARRLGGEQRRDDISARITHNRSLSVPSPPPQRRSHTRLPVAKGTSQCECIHVTHSHAEHMRESIWNRHWNTSVGWVRLKSRGYKRRYTGGESSRSSMRVGVDSDLATTAHPAHTE